jgi:nitrate reductase assembly molybdenum cofactor insertion protein NarJ
MSALRLEYVRAKLDAKERLDELEHALASAERRLKKARDAYAAACKALEALDASV